MICKRLFKKRGLKIHQTKSGCAQRISEAQRIDKSEAARIQEINHSGASCRVNLTAIEVDEVKVEDQIAKGQGVTGVHKTEVNKIDRKMKEVRKEEEKETTAEIDIHIEEDLYMDITSWIKEEEKEEKPKKLTKCRKIKKKEIDRSQDIRKWMKRESTGEEKVEVKDDSREIVITKIEKIENRGEGEENSSKLLKDHNSKSQVQD